MALPREKAEKKFLFDHFIAMEKLLRTIEVSTPSALKALIELTRTPSTALSSGIPMETFESLRAWILKGSEDMKRLTLLAIYLAIMQADSQGKEIAKIFRKTALISDKEPTIFRTQGVISFDTQTFISPDSLDICSLDSIRFTALCGAISVITGPEKLTVELSGRSFQDMPNLMQLAKAISTSSNINNIILHGNRWRWLDLELLSYKTMIQALGMMIKDSTGLISLDLSGLFRSRDGRYEILYLGSLPPLNQVLSHQLCQLLSSALQETKSPIRSLNLGSLAAMDDESLKLICDGLIKMPHLRELSFEIADIGFETPIVEFNTLCSTISMLKLTSLNILDDSGAYLLTVLSSQDYQEFLNFCQAITSPSIEYLSLPSSILFIPNETNTGINQERVEFFLKAVCSAPHLKSLTFEELSREMGSFKGVLKPFLSVLAKPGLVSLDISGIAKEIKLLDDSEFQLFCDVLAQSKLGRFSCSGIVEGDSEKQRPVFLKALASNLNLKFLDLQSTDLFSPEFQYAENLFLQRSKLFGETKCLILTTEMEDFLKGNIPKNLEELSDKIKRLINVLPLVAEELKTFLTKSKGSYSEKLFLSRQALGLNFPDIMKIYNDVLALHDDMYPKEWFENTEQNAFKAEWLIPQKWVEMGEPEKAVEQWLNISRKNPRYQDAHFSAFELSYSRYRSEGQPAHTSFINALPCCLDKNNLIITFTNSQHLKTFDGFLFAAAGIEFRFGSDYNVISELRNLMLRYVLLLDIKNCLPLISPTPSLFQQRQQGLRQLLEKDLPDIISLEALRDQEKSINHLWTKVMEKLDAAPLADEAKNLLLSAVKEFVKEEEKPTLLKK